MATFFSFSISDQPKKRNNNFAIFPFFSQIAMGKF